MNLNAKARLRGIAWECKITSRCKQRETFTEFLLEMVKYCSVAVCTTTDQIFHILGFQAMSKYTENGKCSAEELTISSRTCQTHEFALCTSIMKILKKDFLVSYLS